MISVVIPAHNEAGEIDKLLQEFSSFDGLELVVAEDASTDGTLKSCISSKIVTCPICKQRLMIQTYFRRICIGVPEHEIGPHPGIQDVSLRAHESTHFKCR